MKAVISYITKFLIGGEKADVLASLVGYTSDPNKFSRYRVVIIPSPFFRDEVYGTAESDRPRIFLFISGSIVLPNSTLTAESPAGRNSVSFIAFYPFLVIRRKSPCQ